MHERRRGAQEARSGACPLCERAGGGLCVCCGHVTGHPQIQQLRKKGCFLQLLRVSASGTAQPGPLLSSRAGVKGSRRARVSSEGSAGAGLASELAWQLEWDSAPQFLLARRGSHVPRAVGLCVRQHTRGPGFVKTASTGTEVKQEPPPPEMTLT